MPAPIIEPEVRSRIFSLEIKTLTRDMIRIETRSDSCEELYPEENSTKITKFYTCNKVDINGGIKCSIGTYTDYIDEPEMNSETYEGRIITRHEFTGLFGIDIYNLVLSYLTREKKCQR